MASFRFKPFMFLVTLFGMCARIVSSECPVGWDEPPTSTGKCYKIFDQDKKTYDDARSFCKEISSDLVSILSPIEEEFIFTECINEKHQNSVGDQLLWIGINPVKLPAPETGLEFKWADDSENQFDPVRRTEQMAVALISRGIAGTGSNRGKTIPTYALVDKSMTLPFVCEMQPTP